MYLRKESIVLREIERVRKELMISKIKSEWVKSNYAFERGGEKEEEEEREREGNRISKENYVKDIYK